MNTMKILVVFLFVLTTGFMTPQPEESISVIVNAQNTVSTLSVPEVRAYWMRRPKKRWEGIDKTIKPVDRKDKCVEKTQFYSKILKMTEDAVDSYFTARQYSNGENAPEKLKSNAEIIDYVQREIGAIGFVKSSSLTPQELQGVKVVLVIN
jgi:ABC-type phosphate transport system substrate-binding protein